MIAAVTCDPGSWASRSGGGAGTWSGSRLSWTGCTIVLLGRWLSCSLLVLIPVTGGKRRNQHRRSQQVSNRPQCPRALAAVTCATSSRPAVSVLAGPLRRDQPLSSVGRPWLEVTPPLSAGPSQYLRLLHMQRRHR